MNGDVTPERGFLSFIHFESEATVEVMKSMRLCGVSSVEGFLSAATSVSSLLCLSSLCMRLVVTLGRVHLHTLALRSSGNARWLSSSSFPELQTGRTMHPEKCRVCGDTIRWIGRSLAAAFLL